ncbi:MAG: tRNA (N(6)-L-threonylcarbamoyladenosine(37)-C(2))-methylthiotransferase MtaB [Bacilli bacterium]|nr:tRNA (N(6)-L-threonylcarbamoyladenosine(37)-C(2))-methylthiotransferase MtaB [Bacilli bacterium]
MKFLINTLGCKVNTYESNVIRDIFLNEGYEESNSNVDIAVINTCTVTNTSDSKSLKVIKHTIKNNPNAIVIVCGCFSQINHDRLKDMEGVSIVLGNYNKSKIMDYISQYKKDKKQIIDVRELNDEKFECMKLNNFNKTRAFVKIEDGCENFCSYCIIPYSRGKVRSKLMEEVLDEVNTLVNNGHREIVLTGIHTGHYGADIKEYDFSDLLNEICKIKGLERLRISSIEITELDDKFLETLKNNKIIVDHMHIPLQSGCDKTLKEMNRKYDVAYFKDKIKKIRSIRPNISITTDVIVGFPNETEDDFNTTVNTIKEIKFTKLHVFPFSVRKGTVAETMENQIDEKTKKERVHILMDISKELELDYMNKFVGCEVEFIPEVSKDGYIIGHTGNYLQIKSKIKSNGHETIKTTIKSIEYPYCMD